VNVCTQDAALLDSSLVQGIELEVEAQDAAQRQKAAVVGAEVHCVIAEPLVHIGKRLPLLFEEGGEFVQLLAPVVGEEQQ